MISTQLEPVQQREYGRTGGQMETLCSRADIPRVVERVVSTMEYHHYSANDIFAVRLALEEAVVNAIRHGNQEDPIKEAHVSFLVSPKLVLIEVTDEGGGFDPHKVPDPLAGEYLERPCGRGLHLMRNYMTWVRFNTQGNCVTMCKCRQPEQRSFPISSKHMR